VAAPVRKDAGGKASLADHEPKEVRTTAKVYLERTAAVTANPRIDFETVGIMPGIEEANLRSALATLILRFACAYDAASPRSSGPWL
jgi:hypothetical protein